MSFVSRAALALLALASPVFAAPVSPSCTPFPSRAPFVPSHATTFNVTLAPGNLWKLLTVSARGALTVVAVPACAGLAPPVAPVGASLLALPAPPASAALTSSTYAVAFELTGLRARVAAIVGAAYYSSPCLRAALAAGSCVDAVASDGWSLNVSAPAVTPSAVVIFRNWDSALGTGHDVPVADTLESDPLAVVDYIYFFAAFFGAEDAALVAIAAAQERFACARSLVASLGAPPAQPKVLWGYRWPNPGEPGASDDEYYGHKLEPRWFLGGCPSWYCPLVAAAGGALIPALSKPGNFSDAEFALLAAGADVLIYTGADWDASMAPLAAAGGALAGLAPVRSGRVFDITASGINAWFEQRPAQPDALLQDLLLTLQPALAAAAGVTANVFLRNVFTGKAGALLPLSACNQSAAAVPALAASGLCAAAASAPTMPSNAAAAAGGTLGGGALAGAIVGSVIAGAALVAALVLVSRRREKAAAAAAAERGVVAADTRNAVDAALDDGTDANGKAAAAASWRREQFAAATARASVHATSPRRSRSPALRAGARADV